MGERLWIYNPGRNEFIDLEGSNNGGRNFWFGKTANWMMWVLVCKWDGETIKIVREYEDGYTIMKDAKSMSFEYENEYYETNPKKKATQMERLTEKVDLILKTLKTKRGK